MSNLKWKSIKGWLSYHYDNFAEADKALIESGWKAAGSDNCLGHIYSKTVATQSYGLKDIFARCVGTVTGEYKVERVAPIQ